MALLLLWPAVGGLASAQVAPVPSASTQAPAPQGLMVIETETRGIDPVVGRSINQRVQARAAALGYRVLPPAHSRQAMLAVGVAYPPSMTDLWTVMHRAGAARAAFVTVWAAAGRYAFVVALASADGSGPTYARGHGGQGDLLDRFDRALARVLPPPGQPLATEDPARQRRLQARAGAKYYDTAGPRPPPVPRHRSWRVALQGTTAFGLDDDGFRNHTLGVRFDYRLDAHGALGLSLAYANLKGRQARAQSLMVAAQFEDRVPLTRGGSFHIPLRAVVGYVINNGPALRFAAGLAVDLGERTELVVELLAPTFWVAPGSLLFSLDLGAEVGIRF